MTAGTDSPVIRIVAAVAMSADGKTLLVRKRGTDAFMQPGGKPNAGESPLDALEREMTEELGCGLEPSSCRSLGTFCAPAANEQGFAVEAQLFATSLAGEARPSGEIDEMIWVDPDGEIPHVLAPLTRDHAIPLARELKSNARNRAR